ncbi:MAG: cupin domain-containing protein [Holophagales bacterium]|jgi:mannose-6-phosphate isomerase-like protein (cupin superfamily)|nr:cupin domain-containing protein [Holophagales bacterium]
MSSKHSISELASLITSPFVFLDLGSVNDHVVSVMRIEGRYPIHSHTKDEMYIVLEGDITIQYKNRPALTLQKGESTVVKAYTAHSSGSETGALVLIFKSKDYAVNPSD